MWSELNDGIYLFQATNLQFAEDIFSVVMYWENIDVILLTKMDETISVFEGGESTFTLDSIKAFCHSYDETLDYAKDRCKPTLYHVKSNQELQPLLKTLVKGYTEDNEKLRS